MKRQFVEKKKKKKGEKPLVRWDVGFGMRKSELRTPRCCCFGRDGPMIGDRSLRVVLDIRLFIVFQISK